MSFEQRWDLKEKWYLVNFEFRENTDILTWQTAKGSKFNKIFELLPFVIFFFSGHWLLYILTL